MEKVLILEGISKTYNDTGIPVDALKNINLEIEKGDFAAVIGASGSGKSTLLNICGGLDLPTKGNVYINGIKINELDDDKATVFRRDHIGFVFQDYNLIPVFSVYENVVLPIQLGGRTEDREKINGILCELGLNGMEDRPVTSLSGGQQQRVALARAIASNPDIILADEPTGNLDSENTEEVMKMFRKAVSEMGQTVIMITHNDKLLDNCNRVLSMKDGVLTEK